MNSSLRTYFAPIILGLLISFSSYGASYTTPTWCFEPYVGIDAQIRQIDWADGFGSNLFRDTHIQGNFALGARLNEHFGIEAGYELMPLNKQEVALAEGALDAGVPVPVPLTRGTIVPPQLNSTRFQIKGWHIDLIGYLPLSEPCNIELFGLIGFTRSKIFHYDAITADFIGALSPISTQRSYAARKTFLRLGLGIQQQLSDVIGMRFMVVWENTARFGSLRSKEAGPTAIERIKVKDSLIYGFGLLFNFL